jgi:hypothetical protein
VLLSDYVAEWIFYLTLTQRSRSTTGYWWTCGAPANETNAVPVRTASGPSRACTAGSRIICSSPRWIEYCGQAEFGQLADRVRHQVDADAERPQHRR